MYRGCVCNVLVVVVVVVVFVFQAEDGIRDLVRSRGLGDVYKRQVQKAFVCDPGHRVSIVTITEREFHTPYLIRTEQTPNGVTGIFGSVAYLRQREQIIVQQALQDYTDPVSYTHLTLPTSDLA